MNTKQRPSACSKRKMRSRFASVLPTQRSRKFLNLTTGTAASPAVFAPCWNVKVLFVPAHRSTETVMASV